MLRRDNNVQQSWDDKVDIALKENGDPIAHAVKCTLFLVEECRGNPREQNAPEKRSKSAADVPG
jgi:hypothetical protein